MTHDPRPALAPDASAAWAAYDQAAREAHATERLQDMTLAASKRHRWPTHDNHGGRIECKWDDRCMDCGLLKRTPGPRPPCEHNTVDARELSCQALGGYVIPDGDRYGTPSRPSTATW